MKPNRVIDLWKINISRIILDKSTNIQALVKFYSLTFFSMKQNIDVQQSILIKNLGDYFTYFSKNIVDNRLIFSNDGNTSRIFSLKEIVLNVVNSIRLNIEMSYYLNALAGVLVILRRDFESEIRICEKERCNVLKNILKLVLKISLYTNKEFHLIEKFVYCDNTERKISMLAIEEYINWVFNIIIIEINKLTVPQKKKIFNYNKVIETYKEGYNTVHLSGHNLLLSVNNILMSNTSNFKENDIDRYKKSKREIDLLNVSRINKLKGIISGIIQSFKAKFSESIIGNLRCFLEVVDTFYLLQ